MFSNLSGGKSEKVTVLTKEIPLDEIKGLLQQYMISIGG